MTFGKFLIHLLFSFIAIVFSGRTVLNPDADGGIDCTPLAVLVGVSSSSGVLAAVYPLFTLACYIFTCLKHSGTCSCLNTLWISEKQSPKQNHGLNDQWKNGPICCLQFQSGRACKCSSGLDSFCALFCQLKFVFSFFFFTQYNWCSATTAVVWSSCPSIVFFFFYCASVIVLVFYQNVISPVLAGKKKTCKWLQNKHR